MATDEATDGGDRKTKHSLFSCRRASKGKKTKRQGATRGIREKIHRRKKAGGGIREESGRIEKPKGPYGQKEKNGKEHKAPHETRIEKGNTTSTRKIFFANDLPYQKPKIMITDKHAKHAKAKFDLTRFFNRARSLS